VASNFCPDQEFASVLHLSRFDQEVLENRFGISIAMLRNINHVVQKCITVSRQDVRLPSHRIEDRDGVAELSNELAGNQPLNRRSGAFQAGQETPL
jgi:hypothetical protein